jgi:hypothetical protein
LQFFSIIVRFSVPRLVDRNRCPHSMAPSSPDVTPPDFSLWGCVKGISKAIRLRYRITASVATVPPPIVIRARSEPKYYLGVCMAGNGAYIEL